jgi:hypothetical protein
MSWHIHLADYITDKQRLQNLMLLKKLPALKDDGALGKLRDVIFQYMKDVRKLGKNSPFSVRCILMEWPR